MVMETLRTYSLLVTCYLSPAACDPACVRGTCQGPYCACPEGWTGADCNTPGMGSDVAYQVYLCEVECVLLLTD